MLRRTRLTGIFLLAFCAAGAQLPPQQKVCGEIERISRAGQGIFQRWKGPVARNFGSPEYESMYFFPGTVDPLIKQRSAGRETPVYYYEGVIAEGKTISEIRNVLKGWDTLLHGCHTRALFMKPGTDTSKDENGMVPVVYTLSAPAGGSKTPAQSAPLQVQLSYDQNDDGLYLATILIGYL